MFWKKIGETVGFKKCQSAKKDFVSAETLIKNRTETETVVSVVDYFGWNVCVYRKVAVKLFSVCNSADSVNSWWHFYIFIFLLYFLLDCKSGFYRSVSTFLFLIYSWKRNGGIERNLSLCLDIEDVAKNVITALSIHKCWHKSWWLEGPKTSSRKSHKSWDLTK